jgi:hypothetical protein
MKLCARGSTSRRALACALIVGGLCIVPAVALGWNTDYPPGGCYSTANGLNECRLGYTHALTYNSGTSIYFSAGVCVYAITAAGYIRGGGRIPCTATGTFIHECFSSGPTPNSEARTYAYVTDKWLSGHTDDSPNHTGCF